jgi:hypothetical protein
MIVIILFHKNGMGTFGEKNVSSTTIMINNASGMSKTCAINFISSDSTEAIEGESVRMTQTNN